MRDGAENGLSFSTPWCSSWVPDLIGTLVFVREHDKVLLIHKKTGHGAGLINGPGGKLQPGESVMQCAVRETFEEVGITPLDLQCRAELRFVENAGQQWLGFAFVATDFRGQLRETTEARPFWQAIDTIPYARMWPDDAIWLPHILDPSAHFLVANFHFANNRLLAHEFVSEASIWQDLRMGE